MTIPLFFVILWSNTKMMKKLFTLITSLLFITSLSAQENTDKIKFKPYGFVRNYFSYDSRQCLNLLGETFNVMPLDEKLNDDATEDLNAVDELSFVAFTTRFGVDVSGQRIGKASALAKIEADFCGYGSNNTLFRIRQAYVSLKWDRLTLTCGQTWHPMVIQVMPSVLGLASGSPFAPFNRSPQLNCSIDVGRSWNFTAAALYQFPNTSIGPDGASYDYSRWSKIPEVYASWKYVGQYLTIGAGVDILSLMPRKESVAIRNNMPIKVTANDRVTGVSSEIFAAYKAGKFNLKGKVIYGENTSHLTMVSGYGAIDYNAETGSYKYAPIRSLSSWLNATYGNKVKGGILLGYSKGLGAKQDFISTEDFWMRGAKNTDYIYRISPSATYTIKNLALALELDYTVVGYGDVAINGRTKALRDIDNMRICAMVKYSF